MRTVIDQFQSHSSSKGRQIRTQGMASTQNSQRTVIVRDTSSCRQALRLAVDLAPCRSEVLIFECRIRPL